MASNAVDWTSNIVLLKKINLHDPAFWSFLKEVATALRNHGRKYFDDHHRFYSTMKLEELPFIGVCQQFHMKKLYTSPNLSIYRSNPQNAPGWVFKGTAMCKNAMYIEDGALHLSSSARGYTLSYSQMDMLAAGKSVKQTSSFGLDETSFILPTSVFIEVMSEAPVYMLKSIEDLYNLVTVHNVDRVCNDMVLSLKNHAQLKEKIGFVEGAVLSEMAWCDDGKNISYTTLEAIRESPDDPDIKIHLVATPRGHTTTNNE